MRPLAVILIVLHAGSVSATEGSLAVLDLDARGISVVEAASLTDRLRSELVKTGLVTIVERGAMQAILQEQDFQMSGCTSDECAVEVGQLLGVTQMLAGSIGKVGSTYSIDLRLVDVATGEIVQSVTHDYRGAIDGLLGQMGGLARQLVGLSPDFLPEQTVAAQPAQVAGSGRSWRFKLLVVGAVVAGGGYYVLNVAAIGPPDNPLIGEPPTLPVAPQ